MGIRQKAPLNAQMGLSDLLNYAHLVEEGVIINKDGAFVTAYRFRGPDIGSAAAGESDGLTEAFNRMALGLEDGWMLHVDEIRVPSIDYPKDGFFPDPVSWAVDEERRRLYEAEGAHYENFQFLTFVWKFPLPLVKAARHWFIEGEDKRPNGPSLSDLLADFIKQVQRQVSLLDVYIKARRLSSEDLLSFLNTCITGELLPVAVPQDGAYIDTALARREVLGGYYPKIGKQYLRVLTLQRYVKSQTQAGLLQDLGTYPLVCRFSHRFIALSEETAAIEIKRCRKNWHNKVKGISGLIRETLTGQETSKVDHDALSMQSQTEQALMENSAKACRFGYWTSQVVLLQEDQQALAQAVEAIEGYVERQGFVCVEETLNALDAWLGSVPGHGSANVRRLMINSRSLSHLLPLNSVWAGPLACPKASLLPKDAPPLFYAATRGNTPFRFHMDVSDVGHQFIAGPTGSGKSTLLDLEIAQFFRYEDACVYIFDKDYSHRALTRLLGGKHCDMGEIGLPSLSPLANLSTAKRKSSAKLYIEGLVELQNVVLTPEMRQAVHEAVESLASPQNQGHRTMTVLKAAIQHQEVRKALRYYTLEGTMKMLDAAKDDVDSHHLQTFEMGGLLSQRPEIYLPVLMHLFTQIELHVQEQEGQRPVMIVLEEAWLYIGHEVFAAKLKEWLKTLRKYNVRVVFATQSLSDLYDPETQALSRVTAVILESCPTQVYLPNPAMEEEIERLYKKMGLNVRQREIIKTAVPKREYYVVTPEGKRLMHLGLEKGSLALSILGLSPQRQKAALALYQPDNPAWIKEWLNQEGLLPWAKKISEWEALTLEKSTEESRLSPQAGEQNA